MINKQASNRETGFAVRQFNLTRGPQTHLKSILIGILLTAFMVTPDAAFADNDPEVAWQKGLTILPEGHVVARTYEAIAGNYFSHVPKGTVTILYMHGCAGLGVKDIMPFAEQGFLVIAPNSLTRKDRKPDCDAKTRQVGMFPQAAAYRQQEIRYALTQMAKLPGIDMNKIVLLGHSEGGKAAANWPEREFRAVLVTGWGCHTKDAYYNGSKIPAEVPVFDLVGKQDIWLRINNAGTCESEWRNHRVKTILNPDSDKHELNDVYLPQIVQFIRENTR